MIIPVSPSQPRRSDQAGLPQPSYILHERAADFYGAGVGYLSIKSFFGGQGIYAVGDRRYAVDDRAYLVLNHGQPYTITVAAPAPVESFCVFFAPGFAEAVRRSLVTPLGQLLSDPADTRMPELNFFERTYAHDALLSPTLHGMRRALAAGAAETAWLAEQLHELMGRLLHVHQNAYREAERLPAARPATREELYRRLHLAKEYALAELDSPLALDGMARVAGLSPNHLLRMFKQAFGQTPYQFVSAQRLARAQHLLTHTDQSVTEICLAVGFTSLGSFSWLFRRRFGMAPTEYRQQTR